MVSKRPGLRQVRPQVDGGTEEPSPGQGSVMTTTETTSSELDPQVTETPQALPDPQVQPTMTVPEAGRYFGLQKAASYNAARRGEIPTITVGRRLLVPTAKLRVLLGLDAAATTNAAA